MWRKLKKAIRDEIHETKHKQRDKTNPGFELYRYYDTKIQYLTEYLDAMIKIEAIEKDGDNNAQV